MNELHKHVRDTGFILVVLDSVGPPVLTKNSKMKLKELNVFLVCLPPRLKFQPPLQHVDQVAFRLCPSIPWLRHPIEQRTDWQSLLSS